MQEYVLVSSTSKDFQILYEGESWIVYCLRLYDSFLSSIYSWFLKPLSVLHSQFPTKSTI